LGNLISISDGLEDTKFHLFDQMFEISKQEDLQTLQKYFIHPEKILAHKSLPHHRHFDYLSFALRNASIEKKFGHQFGPNARNFGASGRTARQTPETAGGDEGGVLGNFGQNFG
jgi:hypothetical protein